MIATRDRRPKSSAEPSTPPSAQDDLSLLRWTARAELLSNGRAVITGTVEACVRDWEQISPAVRMTVGLRTTTGSGPARELSPAEVATLSARLTRRGR